MNKQYYHKGKCKDCNKPKDGRAIRCRLCSNKLLGKKRIGKYLVILAKKYLIEEYIKNKKSILTISKTINCSAETIRERLKKYNIKVRGCGETMRGIKKPHVSKRMKGKNHPLFNNWSSRLPYSIDWTDELKESIRNRDSYECQKCNKFGKYVHHIDYNKENCDKNNLITLCDSCNLRANFNRDYWYSYFRYIMENKND